MAAKNTVVDAFVKKNAKTKLTFVGPIDTFENDDHTVELKARAAASVLAGEDDFDEQRYVALGFLDGETPLFVDASKAALPVLAWLDGRPVKVSGRFEAFCQALTPAPTGATGKTAKTNKAAAKSGAQKPRADAATGPKKVYPGPASVKWPTDPVVVCEFGQAIGVHQFLWLDAMRPTAMDKIVFEYVRPKNGLTVRKVGKRWQPATVKLDRGTGVWLDFARFATNVPVVTPAVRTLLEGLQPETLEFLPVRATVRGQTADLFLMNVTQVVPCLTAESDVVLGRELALKANATPTEACFFRPAEYPTVIFATRALVERMKAERLSGIDFKRLPRRT